MFSCHGCMVLVLALMHALHSLYNLIHTRCFMHGWSEAKDMMQTVPSSPQRSWPQKGGSSLARTSSARWTRPRGRSKSSVATM